MIQEFNQALAPGFRLQEYVIKDVLGAGGFGITYLAEDTNLHHTVAIKEYLPASLAIRDGDTSVHARSSSTAEDFAWGLKSFLEEARTLVRFRHPNLVSIHRLIEAHKTAYIVMDYLEGTPLSELLISAPFDETRVRSMLMPILEGMGDVHRAGLLHRDIKPANIIIRLDGTPVLIDFGAARYLSAAHSQSVTAILTPGYAPVEQYSDRSTRQGPWSDIYALGAIAYRMVTGVPKLIDSTERILDDELPSAIDAAKGDYSRELLAAIDWALAVKPGDRPQGIDDWTQSFNKQADGQKSTPSPQPSPTAALSLKKTAVTPKKRSRVLIFAGAAIAAGALIGGVVALGLFDGSSAPVASVQKNSISKPPGSLPEKQPIAVPVSPDKDGTTRAEAEQKRLARAAELKRQEAAAELKRQETAAQLKRQEVAERKRQETATEQKRQEAEALKRQEAADELARQEAEELKRQDAAAELKRQQEEAENKPLTVSEFWQKIATSSDACVLHEFERNNEGSPLVNLSRVRRKKLEIPAWKEASRLATRASYTKYLNCFPAGKFRTLALLRTKNL